MPGDLLNPIFPEGIPGENHDWKNSVRLATAAALSAHTGGGTNTLTASANIALTVDGIAPAVNDRILVKDEAGAAAREHGLYVVVDTGLAGGGGRPWIITRVVDADESADVNSQLTVRVSEGAANAQTQWTLTTLDPIVLNTTLLTFTQTAGAGAVSVLAFKSAGAQTWTALLADDPGFPGTPLEVAFLPNNFTAAELGTARRTVRFQSVFVVDATDGATTFRLRLRLAPVVAYPAPPVGTVIADTGAFVPVAGTVVSVEGTIQILAGVATFNVVVKTWNESLGTWVLASVLAGAVNTAIANDLVFTGLWSTILVGNQVTQHLNEATLVRA